MHNNEINKTNQDFPERPFWRRLVSGVLNPLCCMLIGFWTARLFFDVRHSTDLSIIAIRATSIGASIAIVLIASIQKNSREKKG